MQVNKVPPFQECRPILICDDRISVKLEENFVTLCLLFIDEDAKVEEKSFSGIWFDLTQRCECPPLLPIC
jgi:hypothetical protein